MLDKCFDPAPRVCIICGRADEDAANIYANSAVGFGWWHL